MKTITKFILAASLLFMAGAFIQASSSHVVTTIPATIASRDTIKFYAVALHSETRNGITTYQVNGLPASKTEYDKYKRGYEEIGTCKPCYIRTYSINDSIMYEGDQFTDCPVGYWKEYYNTGEVKVEGQYKTDETGKWNSKKSDKWCGVKHGKWTYYGQSGTVDSVVHYVNNTRVR